MSIEKSLRVSVLMPVYNTEKYVGEAIESILQQTYRDFEFVIIDDGSTDKSNKILQHFAQQDSRIRLISRKNKGLSKTRNELLHEAKGELVAWADSDDISYPNRLNCQVTLFRSNNNLIWVSSSYRLIDAASWPICPMNDPNSYGIGTAMISKKAAIEVGGFREILSVGEDTDLGLRMKEYGEMSHIKEPLIDYRQHLQSVCNSLRLSVDTYLAYVSQLAKERQTSGQDTLQRGIEPKLEITAAVHKPEPAWQTHSRWAWWALGAGNIATARKHAWLAFMKKPLNSKTLKLIACSLRGH